MNLNRSIAWSPVNTIALAPVRARVIQRRIDYAGPLVGIIHWLNHRLQGHFGGFQ